jgi:hypothetical protein
VTADSASDFTLPYFSLHMPAALPDLEVLSRFHVRIANFLFLGKISNIIYKKHMGDCIANFDLRKKIRRLYPGACSLVYQHLCRCYRNVIVQ